MQKKKLNICQVSLLGNVRIIKENLINFNRFYLNNFHYIICPKKEKIFFKKKIKNSNCKIIDEDKIITFKKFKQIANKHLKKKSYFKKIQYRLKWYYQQVLKITFIINFVDKTKKPIIIWDADTIILKKILFFKKNNSINYGTTSEFHKAYYKTNKILLNNQPRYFISSLTQFISITPLEAKFLIKRLSKIEKKRKKIGEWITDVIFKSVASAHKSYNGSMFSEYELIGQSNNLFKYKKQTPILSLRSGLNGKLTNIQKKLSKIFNFKHVTYEHSHPNKNSEGMLKKKQSWFIFIKIIVKNLIKFHLRKIKHNIYHILQ